MKSALVSNVNIELYNALHYHMANKRFLTKDLRNGMVVTSMYNNLGLYINHYSNGVSLVTAPGSVWSLPRGSRGTVRAEFDLSRVKLEATRTMQTFN